MRRFGKYWPVAELACRDGNPVPEKYYDNAKLIAGRADKLREIVGPLYCNSAYRTAAHNKKVGGSPKSQHLTASAMDIRSNEWTPRQLADIYEGLIRLGVVPDGGLGVYDTFIHIDLGARRRWDEQTKKVK